MSQPLQALQQANEVKQGRAAMKRSLGAGEMSLKTVLAEVPRCMRTMSVEDLLRSCPRIGRKKALRLIAHLQLYGIYHSTPLGKMSSRQRSALLIQFREAYPRSWERMAG